MAAIVRRSTHTLSFDAVASVTPPMLSQDASSLVPLAAFLALLL